MPKKKRKKTPEQKASPICFEGVSVPKEGESGPVVIDITLGIPENDAYVGEIKYW